MKNFSICILGTSLLFLSGCQPNSLEREEVIVSDQVLNLYAPQTTDYTKSPPKVSGDFVKFDFSSGVSTSSETDWDIAFRGSTIIINGGKARANSEEPIRNGNAAVYIAEKTFAEVIEIDESAFKQDATNRLAIGTGSGNGWYHYNRNTHVISPIPGRVLVFRTADNKFAKVEILSYYKDAPQKITSAIVESDSRYYTFNYVYQPNRKNTF